MKTLAFLFHVCETILRSLSNVFVKSYKQNIKGWWFLLPREAAIFEHPMLKWLLNTVTHRSFLVKSKCSMKQILLGNSDMPFTGWILVNTWQRTVLYPNRHVSCTTWSSHKHVAVSLKWKYKVLIRFKLVLNLNK